MNPDEVETRALLWSITCGIMLVLAVMVAITCLLLRHNARHQQSGRAAGRAKGTHRRDATRQRPKTIDEGYIEPRSINLTSGRPQPIGNPKMAAHHPQEHSKSSSLEGHIYEEPEHKISDSTSENKYYNASETSSGSGEYERVSYYTNA